ncbi:MAG: hypothetical protein HKO87_02160 [Acidimicrobiia bacterium]|nr:hypothetical protein [Acidimicrobiia bacterium]
MERHLHLVPAGADLVADEPAESGELSGPDSRVVDLDRERKKRRNRYHPAAGEAWLDGLFDDDPLGPVC